MSEETTPTHAPARPGEKVGHDGKLYLPVPHPLVENPEENSWGDRLNRLWRGFNYFLRGLYGTFVEWGISWMDLALEYPRVALVGLMFTAVLAEETMNKHPMLAGTFQYVMFSMDPEAAEIIFPPDADPSDAELVIDKMAAQILTQSADEYYRSAEYKALEMEVKLHMHDEVRSSLYKLSGIEEVAPGPVLAPPVPKPLPAPVETPEELPGIEPPAEIEEE
jgi:hypothetical protein